MYYDIGSVITGRLYTSPFPCEEITIKMCFTINIARSYDTFQTHGKR